MEKISLEETKRIINKIFSQANTGFLEVDSTDSKYNGTWKFYTKFYAKVGENLLKNGEDLFSPAKTKTKIVENDILTPIIQIPDTEMFASLAQQYLTIAEKFYDADKQRFSLYDETLREKLFLDLITNTTNFDRNNIFSYIETRTKMLENPMKTGQFLLSKTSDFSIKASLLKNPSMLEAPYRFTPYFTAESTDNTENKFSLPTITFGVVDDTVYIYAIQAKKEKQTTPLAKKLDRLFRKVNKDVDMEDIIGQVSPNALVALTMFLSVMQKEGIKTVIAPNFMPLRYQSNLNGEKNYFNRTKKGFLEEETIEEIEEKHNRQQFGITNKFTYTLLRYCHHFDGCMFDYDAIKEQSVLTIAKESKHQDNLICDIDKLCSQNIKLRQSEKEKQR